jgi:PIN domain nuclease of toxin-antitoxin system
MSDEEPQTGGYHQNGRRYINAIIACEIGSKFRSGKQSVFAEMADDVAKVIVMEELTELPITVRHAEAAARLPRHHTTRWIGF